MSLPGTIVLRPNEFSGQGYEIIYKDPDGRELTVGRLFCLARDDQPWFWGVTVVLLEGDSTMTLSGPALNGGRWC